MCSYVIFCFFFFKQKTAYEMRISDWSSDVCSSDLARPQPAHRRKGARSSRSREGSCGCGDTPQRSDGQDPHSMSPPRLPERSIRANPVRPAPKRSDSRRFGEGRSEEHTSELQSLMRISYAVFCLQKKKTQ